MALVLVAGAGPASALLSDLLFTSPAYETNATHCQPQGINTNFFATMLGAIPAGDSSTSDQMSSIANAQKNYGNLNLRLPSTSQSADNSWMNNAVATGVSVNGSNSPAMSSYSQLITRFPNQSNIFAPYAFGS